MTKYEVESRIRTGRDTISIAFIGFLVAVAIQEAVSSLVDPNKQVSNTISITSWEQFAIVVVLGLNLFVLGGFNTLFHSALDERIWFFGFVIFAIESTVLILAAHASDASRISRPDFYTYLIVLLSLDVFWSLIELVRPGQRDRPNAGNYFVLAVVILMTVAFTASLVSAAAQPWLSILLAAVVLDVSIALYWARQVFGKVTV